MCVVMMTAEGWDSVNTCASVGATTGAVPGTWHGQEDVAGSCICQQAGAELAEVQPEERRAEKGWERCMLGVWWREQQLGSGAVGSGCGKKVADCA